MCLAFRLGLHVLSHCICLLWLLPSVSLTLGLTKHFLALSINFVSEQWIWAGLSQDWCIVSPAFPGSPFDTQFATEIQCFEFLCVLLQDHLKLQTEFTVCRGSLLFQGITGEVLIHGEKCLAFKVSVHPGVGAL